MTVISAKTDTEWISKSHISSCTLSKVLDRKLSQWHGWTKNLHTNGIKKKMYNLIKINCYVYIKWPLKSSNCEESRLPV